MNDELLGGRPEQVPPVVIVHCSRILQNDDVTGRLLTADDELWHDGPVLFRSGVLAEL